MTPKLKLLENVIERMKHVKEPCIGGLYGIMYERTLLVVGMSIAPPSKEGVEAYLEMQKKFPTGIDFCGLLSFQHKVQLEPRKDIIKNLKEVFITDNPVLLHKGIESDEIGSYFFRNERLSPTEFSVMDTDEFCNTFVTLRLQSSLLLTTQATPKKITKAIENLHKMVSSGSTVFHFKHTNYYIYGGDYNEDYQFENDHRLGELHESTCLSRDYRMQNGVMEISMLLQSSDDLFEDPETYAPYITSIIDSSNKLVMMLPIDALCLAQKSRMAKESYGLLVDTVCRSIKLFHVYLLKFLERPEQICELRQYHFAPQFLGHFVTLIYPQGSSDEELGDIRQNVHEQLFLPMDNPVLRKGNGLVFKTLSSPMIPLLNVHEGLKPSGVKGGKVTLVKGFYSYHHYMQDNFNDNGWGCAYRSFQTLFSWFRLQGYTHRNIPSHYDIQKCLVDIKDKSEEFLGSHQWIGSTEVGFCLETMLGISSRILSVSSGSELDTKGNALMYHFEIQGTPIMIGGGVLAHTILGVHYNQDVGEIKFLVLDPHYQGDEDIVVIQSRGWVGWKGKEFWDKKSFYNLCMPQRPHVI